MYSRINNQSINQRLEVRNRIRRQVMVVALPSPRSVASAFDVSLPVVVSGGMTFLFYVEPILFAYCKNLDNSRTSIPQPYTCALKG